MVSQSSSTQSQVGGPVLARDNHAVDDLDAARRTDAAGRAFAARLDGAELHGDSGPSAAMSTVSSNDDDAAVTEEAPGCSVKAS